MFCPLINRDSEFESNFYISVWQTVARIQSPCKVNTSDTIATANDYGNTFIRHYPLFSTIYYNCFQSADWLLLFVAFSFLVVLFTALLLALRRTVVADWLEAGSNSVRYVAAGPRQHSHPWFWVPRGLDHILLSHGSRCCAVLGSNLGTLCLPYIASPTDSRGDAAPSVRTSLLGIRVYRDIA
jgi:hypothetical protein